MSQSLTFGEAVNRLFFNVAIRSRPADSVVREFMNVPQLTHDKRRRESESLSTALVMGAGGGTRKVTHIFRFSESPLPDFHIDSGIIKIEVGIGKEFSKIINIEWCLQFNDEKNAELYYKHLREIFLPLSTLKKLDEDTDSFGKVSEFSVRHSNQLGVKDVSIVLSKRMNSNIFEIRLFLFNRFAK